MYFYRIYLIFIIFLIITGVFFRYFCKYHLLKFITNLFVRQVYKLTKHSGVFCLLLPTAGLIALCFPLCYNLPNITGKERVKSCRKRLLPN